MIAAHPAWPATLTPWQRVADGGYGPEIDTLLDMVDLEVERQNILIDELIAKEGQIRVYAELVEGLRQREEVRRGIGPRDYADDLVADSEG